MVRVTTNTAAESICRRSFLLAIALFLVFTFGTTTAKHGSPIVWAFVPSPAFTRPLPIKSSSSSVVASLVNLQAKKKDSNKSNETESKTEKQRREIAYKRRQGRKASAQMDLPEQPTVKTLEGGTAMIFDMARRMMVWDEEDALEQKRAATAAAAAAAAAADDDNETTTVTATPPRWHPTMGISDRNPAFRTQSPTMSAQGYAGIIWRNVRKTSKPVMWRYALRSFDRMEEQHQTTKNNSVSVERSTIHYEGALLACAKLGLWERALEIYKQVEAKEAELIRQRKNSRSLSVQVTDNMVQSLIRASIRSVRQKRRATNTQQQARLQDRRAPLDTAVEIVLQIEDKHNIPVVAQHLNPLAAAYQSLGLYTEAADLLRHNLKERITGPEPEDGSSAPLNLNDIRAKDKAAYALLVKGAVSEGDWVGAVDALTNMTQSGLYPVSRHLNQWTEVSERKTKQRTTRSWKKKREEYLLDSVVRTHDL